MAREQLVKAKSIDVASIDIDTNEVFDDNAPWTCARCNWSGVYGDIDSDASGLLFCPGCGESGGLRPRSLTLSAGAAGDEQETEENADAEGNTNSEGDSDSGELSPTEQHYLSLCERELALKLALKGVRDEKKDTEKELERLRKTPQIMFQW